MQHAGLRAGTLMAVVLGGVAALSWEVVWQIHAALSLGVSALGTGLTLASTMGGMTIGSLLMGRALKGRSDVRPLRLYAYLEAVIGLSGLLLGPGFELVAWIDSAVYGVSPGLAPIVHVLSIVLLLGPPTMAMGATVPTFELVGRSTGSSVARLYGVNTAGAAIGVLLLTFVLVPQLGVTTTCVVVSLLNVFVFALMWMLDRITPALPAESSVGVERAAEDAGSDRFRYASLIVFGTGFVTFALEVAWFRALRAAFQSTTDTFAIILASVLIPLAIGARLVPWLRGRDVMPRSMLGIAAIAILLATPLIERMDVTGMIAGTYLQVLGMRMLLVLVVLGPAVLFLGTTLPWYLEESAEPRRTGRLYAQNTLGAVVGSLGAAWILLPSLGFSRCAWLLGGVTAVLALLAPGRRSSIPMLAGAAAAWLVAVQFTSSLGRDRVQSSVDLRGYQIIDFAEGPDSTFAVLESPQGVRMLLIDGFGASTERSARAAYMDWMGHLPMLLHPDPQAALVICFGTGLTTNAVRNENPRFLDVVDVSSTVFEMAPHFRTNNDVLADPRVNAVVMDGRAWLRRAETQYDVITLEPMPPYFAGVNALYSLDFYEIMATRLAPGGVVAQWVPIHLLPPFHSASVVATFHAAFPDSILWLDPYTSTGILLGRRAGSPTPLGEDWPGLLRDITRPLSDEAIRVGVALNATGVALYAERGTIITDDNQLLAYGMVRRELHDTNYVGARKENLDTIRFVSSIQPD